MTDSILNSVKESMGIKADYTPFDEPLLGPINSALATLTQLKVGPEEGFEITGQNEVWYDLVSDTKVKNMVKTYVTLKAKILFDPPTVSAVLEATNNQIAQLEFRIQMETDSGKKSAWMAEEN